MRLLSLIGCAVGLAFSFAAPGRAAGAEKRDAATKPAALSFREKVRLENADIRRVEAADRELYGLQPRKALLGYQPVLTGKPRYDPPGTLDRKASAAVGTARAHAELGHFREALRLMDVYVDRYPSHCGSCQDERLAERQRLRQVWDAAALPPKQAVEKLRRIIAGHFRPYTSRWTVGTASEQRNAAAREASLYLGQLILRQGRQADAKALFLKAADMGKQPGQDTAAQLASGYLKRLAAPGPRLAHRGMGG
jgi:hypothetical protein